MKPFFLPIYNVARNYEVSFLKHCQEFELGIFLNVQKINLKWLGTITQERVEKQNTIIGAMSKEFKVLHLTANAFSTEDATIMNWRAFWTTFQPELHMLTR
jgi:hypothetical protein